MYYNLVIVIVKVIVIVLSTIVFFDQFFFHQRNMCKNACAWWAAKLKAWRAKALRKHCTSDSSQLVAAAHLLSAKIWNRREQFQLGAERSIFFNPRVTFSRKEPSNLAHLV